MVFAINTKKYILAVAVCSASLYASTAMAGGTLLLTGSVSSNTCDVAAYSYSGAPIQTLDLGVVEPRNDTTNESKSIGFTLRPACSGGMAEALAISNQLATITWTGKLGDQGILSDGSSEGVVVVLKPFAQGKSGLNPVAPDSLVKENEAIVAGKNVVTYRGKNNEVMNGEFAYNVSMMAPANAQAGTVEAQITYSVTYL
ncbi:type 1 fimbrial protein [Salmonella enterica]|nr:type 1 fimbrial protein [Salmonella enterica]